LPKICPNVFAEVSPVEVIPLSVLITVIKKRLPKILFKSDLAHIRYIDTMELVKLAIRNGILNKEEITRLFADLVEILPTTSH